MTRVRVVRSLSWLPLQTARFMQLSSLSRTERNMVQGQLDNEFSFNINKWQPRSIVTAPMVHADAYEFWSPITFMRFTDKYSWRDTLHNSRLYDFRGRVWSGIYVAWQFMFLSMNDCEQFKTKTNCNDGRHEGDEIIAAVVIDELSFTQGFAISTKSIYTCFSKNDKLLKDFQTLNLHLDLYQ